MSRKKRKKHADSWGYAWWEKPPPSRDKLLERVEPLLAHIRRVDEIVVTIIRGEGHVADLVGLGKVIREPFSIKGSGRGSVMLAQMADVRSALSSISRELHLEVHAVDGQYPCYLLCRVSTDWDAPDTVLEELYVSTVPNDFFVDERFTILLKGGRSRTFLRLSLFREKLWQWLTETLDESPDDKACDDVLEAVATLVLAAAWYEDQRLPFHVADVFGLDKFRAALELVGFILGSDLYQVTTAIRDGNEDVVGFFEHVYENRPLAQLLARLNRHGVENLADLEAGARDAFVELNQAFSAFMSMTDALGDLESLELYKLVLGCFGNLHEVADREHWTAALEQAAQTIETSAGDCIHRLLPTQCGRSG